MILRAYLNYRLYCARTFKYKLQYALLIGSRRPWASIGYQRGIQVVLEYLNVQGHGRIRALAVKVIEVRGFSMGGYRWIIYEQSIAIYELFMSNS